MNNLEDMMVIWKEMDTKLSALVEENKRLAEEIKKTKVRSHQEKQVRKYLAFIIMEVICIPLMTLILLTNPEVVEKYMWPTLIYFICFFLMEIGFDAYLLYKLNQIDIYKESIVEISSRARRNWKIHKIAIMIGIPIAIVAVIMFCLALGGNVATLWGICVGGSVGLGIGLNEFFKFMKNYKELYSLG